MSETIYILVSDDTDQMGGDFTIMKASFDQAALEKEAAILNTEYNRLRDLFVRVLQETKRRADIAGNWSEHQTAVIKEIVPEDDRRKIGHCGLGPFYTVISTQLAHNGTERTETGAAPDDTQ